MNIGEDFRVLLFPFKYGGLDQLHHQALAYSLYSSIIRKWTKYLILFGLKTSKYIFDHVDYSKILDPLIVQHIWKKCLKKKKQQFWSKTVTAMLRIKGTGIRPLYFVQLPDLSWWGTLDSGFHLGVCLSGQCCITGFWRLSDIASDAFLNTLHWNSLCFCVLRCTVLAF